MVSIARIREPLLVAGGGILVGCLHSLMQLQGFGELDQARDARDAIVWHVRGFAAIDDFSYRLRASSLFMRGLKFFLDHGLPIRKLPWLMNSYSVLMSSVCLVALYYLFKKLSDCRVAAAATVAYAFSPGFWLCSIYGMPTVPAEAYLICGALAFTRAWELPLKSLAAAAWFAGATALCWLAFTHKADLALCSAALLAVPLYRLFERPGAHWGAVARPLALACAVVGSATAGTLLFSDSMTRGHTGSQMSPAAFAAKFHAQYPMSWAHVVNPTNNAPLTHSIGTLWFAISLLASLYGLVAPRSGRLRNLLLLAWALPSIAYWVLTLGNHSRHNVPGAAPLIFLAVLLVFQLAESASRAYALSALVFAASFLDSTGSSTTVPNFNFVEQTRNAQEAISKQHLIARAFLRKPGAKKALIDSDYHAAYGEFEAFASAHNPTFSYDPQTVHDADGTAIQLVDVDLGNWGQASRKAKQLRREGWAVCSIQFGFCD